MSGDAAFVARWFLKNSGKEIKISVDSEGGAVHPGLMTVTCGDEMFTLWSGDLDECFYDMLVGAMFRK